MLHKAVFSGDGTVHGFVSPDRPQPAKSGPLTAVDRGHFLFFHPACPWPVG